MSASDDYVVSRCCILNGLFVGFILACQAIKKLLKAFIYLETEEETKLTGSDKHNPFKLKEQLQKVKKYELDKFDSLLKKLHDHYQSRYYDNKVSGRGASSSELDTIDELWVCLIEALPTPNEVKYRSKFFADLFDEDSRKYWSNYYWTEKNNKALAKKIQEMEFKYKAVFHHLYPKN
ncbi:MAG: hypothetical protein ABIH51_01735 [Patescibacteria group bacterium]